MNDLSYLAFSIIAACLATVAALIIGVDQALMRTNWSANRRRQTVFTVAAVSAGWFAVSVALASLGAYRGAPGRPPTIEFGIVVPILVGCLMIWRWPAVVRLMDALPPAWVIAVQFYRVEGATFLILYASKQLPGIFALPAGIGDVGVGLAALAIGINAFAGRPPRWRTALQWNLFGIADLIIALGTGFLSSPSPFQIFALDRPNELISVFPLVLIPTFLVPLAIILHIVSFIQLGRVSGHFRASAAPGNKLPASEVFSPER